MEAPHPPDSIDMDSVKKKRPACTSTVCLASDAAITKGLTKVPMEEESCIGKGGECIGKEEGSFESAHRRSLAPGLCQ